MTEEFGEFIDEFILDAEERLKRLEELLLTARAIADVDEAERVLVVKRELHTLKGNAGMMGLTELQQLAHAMEDAIDTTAGAPLDTDWLLARLDEYRDVVRGLKGGGRAERAVAPTVGSVRVPFAVLDPLLDDIAEVVILRNRLALAVEQGRRGAADGSDDSEAMRAWWSEASLAFASLGRVLDRVQDGIMGLRLTPLHTIFGSLRRIVHDEATRSGKRADLKSSGGETPLDKSLLDFAADALGHLIRNAVIHGIESPADRAAAAKVPVGTISVHAAVRGDDVRIDVHDDGAGIDLSAARRAAERAGMTYDPADPYAVLFESGVSTRAEADLSAGRGVGLSAVREAVRRQRGEIEVLSTHGRGTTFRLRLPMTVSILRALLVRVDGESYALPLTAVVESRRLQSADGHEINRAGVIRWRDELLPMIDLGLHFGTRPSARRAGYLIVVEFAGKRRGLVVDAIVAVEEVVVRRLDPIVGRPVGVAGSTVLGDGRAILILDPPGLVALRAVPEAA